MKAPRVAVPLFIVCQNRKCGAVKQVRNRSEQQTVKFCSKRCAGIVSGDRNREAARISGRNGGLASGRERRAQLIVKLRGLTQLEAYKKGRIEGWHAGVRSVWKREAST